MINYLRQHMHGYARILLTLFVGYFIGTVTTSQKPVQERTKEVKQIDPFDVPTFKKSFFDAARIYGRAECGDVLLAEQTAQASAKTGLPANVIAAEISVESHCDPLAISHDGGVGLLQIMPKIWASKFDNFREKNLLKAEDSMDVGTTILADNIKQFGMRQGIRRYNGSGPDADVYAEKVMTLAGAK